LKKVVQFRTNKHQNISVSKIENKLSIKKYEDQLNIFRGKQKPKE